jgi:hypothetical protein
MDNTHLAFIGMDKLFISSHDPDMRSRLREFAKLLEQRKFRLKVTEGATKDGSRCVSVTIEISTDLSGDPSESIS